MALLCWLVQYNDNERIEITNHVISYTKREFHYMQLGDFSNRDHTRRAIVECVAQMQASK